MTKPKIVIDMFCGAEGESVGIYNALQDVKLFAINHWERAIETHSKNFPDAEHICESVENINPEKLVRNQVVELLWASPQCTHFSKAKAGKPLSEQSRASAWHILKWVSELYIKRIIIENVPEFMSWGPLDEHGKPIKKLKGKTFIAFINALISLGYYVDWKILCAANYGDPTVRKRLFIQAVKGDKKIRWPEKYMLANGNQQNQL